MSKVNFKKYSILILLAMLAVFAFGCKEEVRVKDIYFAHSEQIVLLVGEELTPNVVVTPSYADNTDFTISSSNSSVVSVANNKIKAQSEGTATIKVVAKDNSLLEDMITVSVKSSPSKLQPPTGLQYSVSTQTISFSMSNNASAYVLSVNGVEINMGNSNSISLDRINEVVSNAFDTLLRIKVKAKAPTYTKAFVDSDFSSEFELFQVSPVKNVRVESGILKFDEKSTPGLTYSYDIFLDNTRLKTVNSSNVNLTTLNNSYAGKDLNVSVVATVKDKTLTDGYYASTKSGVLVNVVDAVQINMNDTQVFWNAASKVSQYAIYIDGVEKTRVSANHMLLSELAGLTVQTGIDYKLKIEPILEGCINVAKTSKTSEITFNKLATPTIMLDKSNIVWSEDEFAGSYYITLKSGTETLIDNSTLATSYSLANYPAGTYDFSVKASGKFAGGVFYIASDVETKTSIVKNNVVEASIDDYNLNFKTTDGENYSIKIDNELEQIKSSADLVDGFNLKGTQFESGRHEIVIKHLGNGTSSIDSAEIKVEFIQLEKINAIAIENSTVKLNAGELNTDNNAIINIIVRNKVGTEKLTATGNSLEIKQGDLPAGDYSVVAQVIGTGSSTTEDIATFSYMEGGEVVDCCSFAFTVLETPTLVFTDNSKTELTFNSIENVERYEIFKNNAERRDGIVEKDDSTVYGFSLGSGEVVDYKIVARGNGENYLDSNYSENITITKLATPEISFDNVNNKIIKVDNNDASTLSYSYVLKHNNVETPYDWQNAFGGLIEGENKFTLQLTTTMENYVNSNESESLKVEGITKESTLSVNTNNQLVVAPTDHTRKFNLHVEFNFGAQIVEFRTSEDGVLLEVGGTREINYSYTSRVYYINLLNGDYTPVLNEMENNFDVRVVYFANENENYVASGYSASITIQPLEQTTLSRNGQNIVFNNIVPTGSATIVRTYRDFALLVNGSTVVPLNALSVDGDENATSFSVPMSYITARATLSSTDPNTIQVITINSYNETENEALSVVGEAIKVIVEPSMMFSTSKDNEATDNSVIVTFDTYSTSYEKSYIVYVYNETIEDGKTFTFTDADDTDRDGKISIRLDDINLTGVLKIHGIVSTSASHEIVEENKETVYHFNSVASSVISFTKVEVATNLIVENGILKFETKDESKVFGYEIYDIETGKLIQFVTTNSHSVQNLMVNKEYEFAVKAIAKENDNVTNSSMSESVKMIKLATPTVSTYYGDLSVGLSEIALELLASKTDSCELVVRNKTTGKERVYRIDDNSTLQGNSLIISCFDILSYGSANLSAEEIEVYLKVNATDEERGVQYINSDVETKSVYGMFAPTNVEITTTTTETNEYPEYIKWQGNSLNVLNSASIEGGYQFKITYKGETYLSTDEKLIYLKNGVQTPYGLMIDTKQCVFPTAYDLMKFGAGVYTIAVRTVSANTAQAGGVLVCGSHYSQEFTFEIMATPEPTVVEGVVTWGEINNAENYSVKVDAEASAVIVDGNSYVYSNSLGGMFEVVVQAKDGTDNTILNSEISLPMSFLCLPSVKSGDVNVDDGRLYVAANKFFTVALIQFVDISTKEIVETVEYANEKYEDNIKSLGISSWADLDDLSKLNENSIYEISIPEEKLKNLIGGNYNINIQLLGNSHETMGIINSTVVQNVDNLNVHQLTATNLYSVKNGVLTVALVDNYSNGIDVNNVWNNVADEFLRNTPIFKIEVETSNAPYEIYAVDYYSFINAKSSLDESNFKVYETEEEIRAHGDLYGYYVFNYLDEENNDVNIFINIFKENKINLRDYNFLKYYQVQENVEAENGLNWSGVSSVIDEDGNETISTINLAEGGTFVVRSTMLGGDLNGTSAYLTSNTAKSDLFVRYKENNISTSNGLVRFKDQTAKMLDEENSTEDNPIYITIDKPIYRLIITGELYDDDSTEFTKIFYLYQGSELPERMEFVNNPGQFVEIEETDIIDGYVYFDIQKYCEAGAYDINIRTFAGVGDPTRLQALGLIETNPQDYLIDSKETATTYPIRQLKESQIVALKEDRSSLGYLTFNRGYVLDGASKEYCNKYEVTISYGETEFIYQISSSSEGIKISDEIVQYKLPHRIINKDGEEFEFDTSLTYEIKIRPISDVANVVNGRYFKIEEKDHKTKVEISADLTDLRVEDGVLRWTSNGTENKFVLRLIWTDKDGKQWVIYAEQNAKAGTAQEFAFSDGTYTIEGVKDQTSLIESAVDYIVELRGYSSSVRQDGVAVLLSEIATLKDGTETIPLNRIARVDNSSIVSVDGKLRWNHVENAVSYEIVAQDKADASKQFIFNYVVDDDSITYCELDLSIVRFKLPSSVEAEEDEDFLIDAGNYIFKIRAFGDTKITAMNSKSSAEFEVLGTVQKSSIELKNDGKTLTWDPVENADGYSIVVRYLHNGSNYTASKKDKIEGKNEFDISSLNVDLSGKFEIDLRAIGVGEGNVLTGPKTTFESSIDTPQPVKDLMLDDKTTYAFTWTSQGEMFEGDKFEISYKFKNNNGEVDKSATVSYVDGQTDYSFPLTEIGTYSNFKVYVKRSGAASSLVQEWTKSYEFNKFNSGAGELKNPYIITSKQHLMNIALSNYNTKHFVVGDNIELNSTDVQNCGGYLVAENFEGSISGLYNEATYSIKFADEVIDISNFENFALFGNLNNATISNLFIAGKTSTKFTNLFAKDGASVLNLSLVARNAINSTIQNVNVENIEYELEIEKGLGSVYVAGLVAYMEGGSISGCVVENLAVKFVDSNKNGTENVSSSTTYIGGLVAKAVNKVTMVNCSIYNLKLQQTKLQTVAFYVGGVAGHVTVKNGNTERSLIKNVNVGEIETDNEELLKVREGMIVSEMVAKYFGGIVGLSEYVNIENCSTVVDYALNEHKYETNIGGIVGVSNNTTITSVEVYIKLGIKSFTSRNDDQFIGALAGRLNSYSAINGYVVNAEIITTSGTYEKVLNVAGKTQISNIITSLGLYGNKDESNVTIN